MAKAGRKKGKRTRGQPAGLRTASGRLRHRPERHEPQHATASDGIVRRRAMYGAPADDRETFDALGRAWSAGLLHPEPARAKAMLDAGRRLAANYWRAYGFLTPDSLARFQPSSGTSPANDADVRQQEERLTASLEAIGRLGRATRSSFDQLVVDLNPDHGPPWLDRIIFAHRRQKIAGASDYAALRRATDGLAELA